MTADRITYNEPDDFAGPAHELGTVDEIVLSAATVHLEMLSSTEAHFAVRNTHREVHATIHARLTTRAERRDTLRAGGDTLAQHLRQLLPSRRFIWAAPWWRRPASVWRCWRDCRRDAGAVLLVTVEEDEEATP